MDDTKAESNVRWRLETIRALGFPHGVAVFAEARKAPAQPPADKMVKSAPVKKAV